MKYTIIRNEKVPLTWILTQGNLLLKQITESLSSIQQVETTVDELQVVRAVRSKSHIGWRTKTTQKQGEPRRTEDRDPETRENITLEELCLHLFEEL